MTTRVEINRVFELAHGVAGDGEYHRQSRMKFLPASLRGTQLAVDLNLTEMRQCLLDVFEFCELAVTPAQWSTKHQAFILKVRTGTDFYVVYHTYERGKTNE